MNKSHSTIWKPLPRFLSTQESKGRAHARRGFTLIEVLVTLGIMMIMMAIIFVPLNSAFNIFQTGQSRNDLQLASRQTMARIETDLQKAIYVFPNASISGITDKPPFGTPGNSRPPYFERGTCARVANTARIDMLLPLRDDEISPAPSPVTGSVVNPIRPAYYVVTYYARLDKPNDVYDAINNPLRLYRTQMPYKSSNGADVGNIDVSTNRYAAGCTATPSGWLVQDEKNQPDLSAFSQDTYGSYTNLPGSEEVVSSRELSMLPKREKEDTSVTPTAPIDYSPSGTSFLCNDVNGDGKIDRVTLNLTLVQYDLASVGSSSTGQPTYQQNAYQTVVNLPNVR